MSAAAVVAVVVAVVALWEDISCPELPTEGFQAGAVLGPRFYRLESELEAVVIELG